MAQYKDGYEDIVEARRHFSDLKYSFKQRQDVPQYKYRKPRTPVELTQNVLNSDRVKYAIEKVTFFVIKRLCLLIYLIGILETHTTTQEDIYSDLYGRLALLEYNSC